MTRLSVVRYCLLIAGFILFLDSVLGLYAATGMNLSSAQDVLADLCVTMAFPVFLIAYVSLRIATVSLWMFFGAQWLNTCFESSHRGFVFVNPLDWPVGWLLLLSVVLVSFSSWALSKDYRSGGRTPNLRTVFGGKSTG
jgi:hypothetical protein